MRCPRCKTARYVVIHVTEVRPGVFVRIAHCENCGLRRKRGRPYREYRATIRKPVGRRRRKR
jgi:transcription elongation factor Elf1